MNNLPEKKWDKVKNALWKGVGVVKNNTWKLLALQTALVLLYAFSSEIWFVKNKWKITEANEYVTLDKETNIIIKMVNWLASKSDIVYLEQKYWNVRTFVSLANTIKADSVGYKALSEIMMLVHNPHVTFSGNYQRDIIWATLWYDDSKLWAYISPFSSKIHVYDVVSMKWLIDTMVEKSYIPDSLYDWGNRVLTNWIFAELAHMQHMHRVWIIKHHIDYTVDYLKNGFDQSSLYSPDGNDGDAVEKIAHVSNHGWAKWIEGGLEAIYLQKYEQYMPENSLFHLRKLKKYYSGYFDNYRDTIKAGYIQDRIDKILEQQAK